MPIARDRHSRQGIWRTMAIALAAAMTLSLGFAGLASAEDGRHRLFSENLQGADGSPCPAAKDQWLSFNSPGNKDSPLDSNTKAYRLTIPAGCYIAAATNASLALNKRVSQIKNLSFDWRTPAANPPGSVAGGSPRLVAFLDNGSLVAMDALNCRRDIPASAGTWARTDVTGFRSTDAPCTIFVDNTIPYSNTPTKTAWQVFAAANPSRTVTFTFFVADVSPGTYYVDRVSLATGKLYGNGNSPSQNCPNEGSC